MTKPKPKRRRWSSLGEVERASLLFDMEQLLDSVGDTVGKAMTDFPREMRGIVGFPFKADVRITLVPVKGSTEQPIEVEVGLLDRMLKDVEG